MTDTRHMKWLWILAALLGGCIPPASSVNPTGPNEQIIRVRLLSGVSQVDLAASGRPRLAVDGDPNQRELLFPPGGSVPAIHLNGGWRIGSLQIAAEKLTLWPADGGTLTVNGASYRGDLRLIPVGDGAFDVVNDVQIDDYLKGVLACEMYHDWPIEAYKAQAVVARTYALFQSHTEGLSRYWDVWSDVRSQVYGGMNAETDKSRSAVAETAGLVLAYGSGEGRIFPTFFSSDSGGVTQSAIDAFGGPAIPPLAAHSDPGFDGASPYANWGPIPLAKAELTRRVRLWASRRSPPRPETTMALLANVEVVAINSFGRPARFRLTDVNGATYLLAAEEMRAAFNTDAPSGGTLPSSFCKVTSAPGSDEVIFYDGHGFGHGVGMSQWSAQQQALHGQTYDQILMSAYPQAKLARAY
jgi:stage II sporulation protein D